MPKILLFIPFYNCGPQITRVLSQVKAHRHYFSTVLLVDNGSTDQGVQRAQDFIQENNMEGITLVRNKQNYNLGGSHKVAFQYAQERGLDYVVVLHGDNQANLNDILEILDTREYEKHDCLLGARFHPDSKLVGYSSFRILGNRFLNFFCGLACGDKILDMGAGLNMYSRAFFTDRRVLSFPNDLTFNIYLLFFGYFNRFRMKFFPITWVEEDQVSNARVFRQFFKIILLIMKTSIHRDFIYEKKVAKETYGYDVL